MKLTFVLPLNELPKHRDNKKFMWKIKVDPNLSISYERMSINNFV
jgi:hypothetical protein